MSIADLPSLANISQYFLFFVPGFIAMQVGGLLVPLNDNDFSKRVPVAIGYSALNFAFMTLVLTGARAINCTPLDLTVIQYAFLFVIPALYPFAFKFIREHQWFGVTTPFPTAWDEFFSKRKQYWIRVHFKDGNILTGWYGSPDSAASQYPEAQQLYISEVWVEVQGKMNQSNRTAGIIVSMSEVCYLEFIN